MVKIYELKYRGKDGNARTLLNHTLFGRLLQNNNKKVAYYNPGILDEVKFKRKKLGNIFVEATEDITEEFLKDVLGIFGSVSVAETEGNISDYKTGREYWMDKAKERNINVKVNHRCRRKILGMFSKS